MKTTITITGQIGGNLRLVNAISSYSELKRLMFNNYQLIFPTKKQARKALWEGYKYLRSNEPGYSGVSYSAGWSLSYDASQAVINTYD